MGKRGRSIRGWLAAFGCAVGRGVNQVYSVANSPDGRYLTGYTRLYGMVPR